MEFKKVTKVPAKQNKMISVRAEERVCGVIETYIWRGINEAAEKGFFSVRVNSSLELPKKLKDDLIGKGYKVYRQHGNPLKTLIRKGRLRYQKNGLIIAWGEPFKTKDYYLGATEDDLRYFSQK